MTVRPKDSSMGAAERDLPPYWREVLERAAASDGDLFEFGDTGSDAARVEQVLERLVDLGYLRVLRARCYSLTPEGRQLLGNAESTGSQGPRRSGSVVLLASILVLLVVFGALAWMLL